MESTSLISEPIIAASSPFVKASYDPQALLSTRHPYPRPDDHPRRGLQLSTVPSMPARANPAIAPMTLHLRLAGCRGGADGAVGQRSSPTRCGDDYSTERRCVKGGKKLRASSYGLRAARAAAGWPISPSCACLLRGLCVSAVRGGFGPGARSKELERGTRGGGTWTR
jgi:hypothetical protein